MKKNELKELHAKTIDELQNMLETKKRELLNARLEHTRGKLKNPRDITALRGSIAKISTIVRGKELANDKDA